MIPKSELSEYLSNQKDIWEMEQNKNKCDQTFDGYCSGRIDAIEDLQEFFNISD